MRIKRKSNRTQPEIATLSPEDSGCPLATPIAAGARTLLAGSAETVESMLGLLAGASPRPRVVGCVLTGSDKPEGCGTLGGLEQVVAVARRERAGQVLLSLPMAERGAWGTVVAAMNKAGLRWRFLPTLEDQLAGRALPAMASGLMEGAAVDIAALIDRQPRPLDEEPIRRAIQGKTVMITGSGGSIGSELARKVCGYAPSKLLLVERSENSLFEIDREIARLFPAIDRLAVLHDVTQEDATLEMCIKHRPAVVFHAAAHKHVPMMEEHPAAAIENNFYGTRSIADAAAACAAERFVMISTDKAVNPSSVMGATKRLAELYVQEVDRRSQTVFSMVRFGNVLGSACSVLPIWTKQLGHGGPITVTDERMTRYFMTIPEASGLVLQAGAYSTGGEVFLLDMGEPVKILALAQRFVRSHGLEPGEGIEIKLTGARPGEKLFEELAYGGEDMQPTPHPSLCIWGTAEADPARIQQVCERFDHLRNRSSGRPWGDATGESIVTALRSALPEMVRAIAG